MGRVRNLLFFLLLVSVFCCCNKSKDQEKYIIGFSQFSSSENWKEAVIQSMYIEAGFHKNISLNVVDSKSDVDRQISDIENFIDQKVDVIIVSPIAPKPLKSIIKKAIKNKIPVIVLDREISVYDSFIGVNNYEVGVNAAKYLKSLKRSLKVVEIKGWAGTTPTKHISLGFRKNIQINDSLDLVGSVQDSYDGSGIAEKLKDLITRTKEIDYVFAHSDDLALQAYQVFQSTKKHKGIKFVGVGGLNSKNEGLDLVKREIFEATVLCPTGGKEAIQTAISLINGEEVNSEILLPSVIVDKTNVDLLSRQLALINDHESDIKKQQERIDNQVQLYNSQRDFLVATLVFLGIIITLLIITLRAKRKLIQQKRLLVKLIDQIDSQKKEIEKIAEDLRVTNETTNNFFMGVSHDFKTPISLILSSTESLIGSETDQKTQEFNLIYNNSRRLLRMINQLLDFRRVESRSFKLKASKTNIETFVNAIFSDFNSEARKKEIQFSLKSKIKEPQVFIDRDLFDNILFNLLSNAFKFTPIGGEINVAIEESPNKVFIAIKDTGIGVPSSEKEKIFNQFYQGTNNQKTSSGIGLFLTKEYIKLHSGEIRVISEKGEGAEFIISIPKGKSHLKTEEIISEDIKESKHSKQQLIDNTIALKRTKGEKERLLIIEDNNDLRVFLKEKLSDFYEVYDSDGIKVKEKILETIPDVIISDVNLPEISGFEICEMVKTDERTSHIPVLILTALKTDEAHLKGLKSGVDMFLTKPFNLSVLFQSLETLLYNRKKLQKYFKETSINLKKEKEKENKKKIKDKESDFLNKIDSLIDEKMDDSSFTVELLAEELNISRVQLYRKIKALLGITISDYIQNIRLEKGKEMLLSGQDLSIADIAYSVGFSSPNYFSTAFKAKYGETPKKYKKSKES
ncbi:hybrid sensor histidine kinase/response regulator transcription factor [Tenacibaculum jejuense]|uniref:histidine kinase n=1 Tax=Tenacibaculum jejuense TaxID=584609 RepID=A0A238U6B7_9FLAO|nr:substrate-binding domain-containing protein [Tenacibaculum jejuense]SNR14642.1 Probable hybrid two-component system sensor histidine kinase and response regulator receiver [Tenacibaculum jejuense]